MLKNKRLIIVKTMEHKAGYVFALSRSTEDCPTLLSSTEA